MSVLQCMRSSLHLRVTSNSQSLNGVLCVAVLCRFCQGQGVIVVDLGMGSKEESQCINCEGNGSVTCTTCNGSGVQPRYLDRRCVPPSFSINLVPCAEATQHTREPVRTMKRTPNDIVREQSFRPTQQWVNEICKEFCSSVAFFCIAEAAVHVV